MTRRRLSRTVVALLLAALVSSSLGPARAHAGVAGSGTVDPSGLTVGLQVQLPGQPPIDASDPSAPTPFRTIMTPADDPTNPLAGLCNPAGPALWGWTWTVTTIDNATGAIVASGPVCVALPDPSAAPGSPPVVAMPPTIGEIWAHAALPTPTLGLSPIAAGVTGLPTWVWGASPLTVAIDATINGYTVTGTATLVSWRFDTGDGAMLDATAGGDADHPAVQHVYERDGSYALSITTTWDATVTISGPDFANHSTPIGHALVRATHDYPVEQVRAILTG